MELDITEFHAPSPIRFELIRLMDNFTGSEQFTTVETAEHTTMTGTVEVNADGLSGAVLLRFLRMVVGTLYFSLMCLALAPKHLVDFSFKYPIQKKCPPIVQFLPVWIVGTFLFYQ